MQKFLGVIGESAPDLSKLKNIARDDRPFVPEVVWAYFSAITSVLYFNLIRLQVLQIGLEDPQKYVNAEYVKRVLKAALPHQSAFIDEHDAGAYYYLLEELEENLLNELRKVLEGKQADQAAAQRAKEIMNVIKEGDAEQARETANVALPA